MAYSVYLMFEQIRDFLDLDNPSERRHEHFTTNAIVTPLIPHGAAIRRSLRDTYRILLPRGRGLQKRAHVLDLR